MKLACPHCGNDDESMLEEIGFIAKLTAGPAPFVPDELKIKRSTYLCVSCSKEFTIECN